MYIREVKKRNNNSDKVYSYYRLVHGYKLGNKTRQQTILNLGKLEELDRIDHKALADRIETLLTGATSIFANENAVIESLASKFVSEIQKKNIFPSQPNNRTVGASTTEHYQEVNIDSIEEEQSREIGGEWLCKQAFDKLGLSDLFLKIGLSEKQVTVAQMLLTAKLLHPSSELETERWLKENSGAMELYGEDDLSISRYHLYQAGTKLYEKKDEVEQGLYSICSNLFSQRNKIVIYDLTNIYFEGQMQGSSKANFGRSKEKRSDCRLISLAMSIDSLGFVRHCEIYSGNISEPETFKKMLEGVRKQLINDGEKPLIVMDAGISTAENLTFIRDKEYDYVCVSRTLPKEYERLTEDATSLTDNRGNKIEVCKVSVDGTKDCFLHIKSDQKVLKEESMDKKITERFLEKLTYLKEGLELPRRTKNTIKVHESIGRLKDKYSKAAKLYTIEYQEDKEKEIVTNITWTKIKKREKPKGQYFLRYSKENLTEKEIWDSYNLTREVEASFRCLKTDLNIRPIHHQKDAYIEPHIWLGIVAYQVVNYIRQTLKGNNINYSWTTIIEKMKTQKSSIISMDTKESKRIYMKLCTRPNVEVKKIYDTLNFKDRPYVRKTKVVTQL